MSEQVSSTSLMVRRYVAGDSVRQIAAAERAAGRKISYETVRKLLKEAGVTLRQRRRIGGRLGSELLADLAEHFPAGASVPELMEWFGEDRRAVLVCLSTLLKHGYLAVVPRTGA